MKVQSITPDLHKVLIVGGIDHKFAIITILVGYRIEILHFASLGTLNEYSIEIADHMFGINLDQIAVVAGSHIALPTEAGGAIDGKCGAV